MPGHEFRQAQTAIISEYIDRQNNFGLYYETPVLGKPWAFPLEFPLYQWAVVGVKRALDVKLIEAARGVSLASFYVSLPAFWLLLGSYGVSAARRWVVLAVSLVCPAFIFYSRAFLIDPMAMSFSAWFLAAFVRMMDTRRVGWLIVCTVAGTAGALIKSLVFAVWLFPAACYGAWCLWRNWREQGRGSAVGRTVAWGLGAVVLPLGTLKWWIGYTDAIKESHRSGYIFTSKNLSVGNFGTFSLESRLSLETWQVMMVRWSEAIASPWVVLVTLVCGVALCRRARDRTMILGAAALWMFGQLAFPYAYAYQDYYFYAGAAFLMFAFGVAVTGLWENGRGPLILRGLIGLVPLAGMAHAYKSFYLPQQQIKSLGGSGMADVLRDFLPPDSVIVGLGQDWSAILAYYSKHRALMVRNGLDADLDYLRGAIDDLNEEDVGAVVVTGPVRENRAAIELLIDRLGLVPTPLFTHLDSTVYMPPTHYARIRGLLTHSRYDQVKLEPLHDGVMENHLEHYRLNSGSSRVAFPMVKPGVTAYRIKFGYNAYQVDGEWVAGLHPPADLWLRPRGPLEGRLVLEYGLTDPSWNRDVTEGDKTDGVEFALWAEQADDPGTRRLIWQRWLDPRRVEKDRGQQRAEVPIRLEQDEQLVLTSRPGPTMSYDWAYLANSELMIAEANE